MYLAMILQPRRHPFERGASLIEVLIALFLVAVTMLGLLGLQLRALGLQKDSLDRRTAAVLVSGFADHISMNFAAFTAGNFVGSMLPGDEPPASASACSVAAGGCNPGQAAAREFALFASAVRARLPEGGAWVASDTNRAVITLAWRDIRRVPDGETGIDPVCSAVGLDDANFRCYSARVAP